VKRHTRKSLDTSEALHPSSGTPAPASASAPAPAADAASDADLARLEAAHPEGLSTQEVVEFFADRPPRLSEAAFRKYVQLGLLPRSVRVGSKGKHRGSRGLYPATVVRQIDLIRRLMARGYTIPEIRAEFVSLRSDIDDLVQRLARVLGTLERGQTGSEGGDEFVARAVTDARAMSDALIEKLRDIERRLSMRARMARAVV
jgi:DNA-binding transcriptional MerR regulator